MVTPQEADAFNDRPWVAVKPQPGPVCPGRAAERGWFDLENGLDWATLKTD